MPLRVYGRAPAPTEFPDPPPPPPAAAASTSPRGGWSMGGGRDPFEGPAEKPLYPCAGEEDDGVGLGWVPLSSASRSRSSPVEAAAARLWE